MATPWNHIPQLTWSQQIYVYQWGRSWNHTVEWEEQSAEDMNCLKPQGTNVRMGSDVQFSWMPFPMEKDTTVGVWECATWGKEIPLGRGRVGSGGEQRAPLSLRCFNSWPDSGADLEKLQLHSTPGSALGGTTNSLWGPGSPAQAHMHACTDNTMPMHMHTGLCTCTYTCAHTCLSTHMHIHALNTESFKF